MAYAAEVAAAILPPSRTRERGVSSFRNEYSDDRFWFTTISEGSQPDDDGVTKFSVVLRGVRQEKLPLLGAPPPFGSELLKIH